MRMLFAAMALAFLVQTPTNAQNCESLTVRDAAGQVIATKQICVDANGAWVDPAAVQFDVAPAEVEPVLQTLSPLEPAEIVTLEAPAVPEAVTAPAEQVWQERPVEVIQQLPAISSTPVIAETPVAAPIEVLEPAISTIQPVTPKAAPSQSNGWQPTSGAAKRQQLYAKLGLVCVAEDAKFCTKDSCSGLCTGQQGWCDGKTGEVHASLEAIERIYCRKKKRR